MIVSFISFNAEHTQIHARGLARTIARLKLKILIFGSKFEQKNHDFQPLACDGTRQTARTYLKVLGAERYNQDNHFEYLICEVLKLC